MKMRYILVAILLMSFMYLANAQLIVGYDFTNPSQKVIIEIPDSQVNQSVLSVNNSLYWNHNLWSDTRWLNIDGSNANQNIDIGIYNITAGGFIGDGSGLTNLNLSGINFTAFYPHDQELNTTSNVIFDYIAVTNNITAKNMTVEILNVTQDLYVRNSTIYLGNVSISSIVLPSGEKIVTFGDSFINATGYFGDGGFLDNISFVNGTVTAISFNGTQFTGGNFTGDNFTGNFYGTYDWTAEFPFLYFNGTYLTFNETSLLEFVNGTHDQYLNTTSNVSFNTVTSIFFGTYDWTAEFPWLYFNGTYLSFNDTYLDNYVGTLVNQSIGNYTFDNITIENINITGSVTLNESTITGFSEVNYTVSSDTVTYITGLQLGTYSVILPNLLDFEISQITVTPTNITSSDKYRFAMYEVSGEVIDRDRMKHSGIWSIFKSYGIDNNQITLNFTEISPANDFEIEIKYFRNVNN